MTYHNTDNLKLEIEVTPEGLPNLAQNPTGEKGSWAYATPVANTNLTSDGTQLTFTTTATQACHMTTEYLPVTAGKYVAARFDAVTGTSGSQVKLRFEWYDSSKVLLSSSTQSAYFATTTAQTNYLAAIVAPTNTAYVKLRWDFYANTSAGNPTANSYFTFTNVMVTWATTTGEIGSLRSNLMPNPNFEVDTFGWTSTTATLARTTSTFSSGAASLSVTFSSSADFIYSPMFAVTGGSTYSAQIKTKAATTARIPNVYFYWYDSSGVYISGSMPGASTNNTSTWTTTKNENKTAPSNAAFARLRIYDNGIPSGEVHYIDDVMVEVGSTAGTYFDGSSTSGGGVTYAWTTNKAYTNLMTNPSAETNTTGWTKWTEIGASGTLSRTTTQAKVGSASLMVTGHTGGQYQGVRTAVGTSGMPVTAGTKYTLKASLRATSGITGSTNYFAGNIFWYDSAGNLLGALDENSIVYLYTNATASTWTDVTYSYTAPAGAAYACVALGAKRNDGTDITGSADFFADAVYFGADDIPYFDGSTTDVASFRDYAWTGTTNNSTSTLTIPSVSTRTETSNFDYTEPVDWRNILGPTHEIKIQRQELDVGLLNATILDALLDPAVADVIRPGKKVRAQALVDDVWTDLFNGVVSNAHVTYDKEKIAGSEVETRIELSASDAIAHLANQGEVRGIEDIEDLPYILEGKGVPWNVNGNGNQVASASIVSYNDNASVLDQVAVTRDTNRGYAWVDKSGVLNVFDSAEMNNDVQYVFTDVPSGESATLETFESGISGWNQGTSTAATITQDSTIKHSGTYALKMIATTGNYETEVWYNGHDGNYLAPLRDDRLTRYPVEPNTYYRATLWVYTNSDADYNNIDLDFYDVDGNWVNGGSTNYGSSFVANTWTKVTVESTSPANAAYAGFYFHMYHDTTPGILYTYIDDIAFEEVTNPGYTNIDVDFDMDRCINSVMVNWLRYDVGSSTTTEIPYGPYENATSIATYGARSATFTIHGATESGASIASYANQVLIANATPRVRTNSLTVPVRDAHEMAVASSLDLYSYVAVWFDEKQDGDEYYITGLEHNITPEKWSVNVSFAATTSVAAPTWTPSPPMQPVEENIAVLNPVGAITMFAAATAPDGWLLCEGGTFSSNDYPQLAALLGDTYGVHSGTTYYLPNFSAKFPRGGTPGDTGGASSVTLVDTNLPRHTHSGGSLNVASTSSATGASGSRVARGTTTNSGDITPISGQSGTGTGLLATPDPVTVLNPYLNIKFIIKADA